MALSSTRVHLVHRVPPQVPPQAASVGISRRSDALARELRLNRTGDRLEQLALEAAGAVERSAQLQEIAVAFSTATQLGGVLEVLRGFVGYMLHALEGQLVVRTRSGQLNSHRIDPVHGCTTVKGAAAHYEAVMQTGQALYFRTPAAMQSWYPRMIPASRDAATQALAILPLCVPPAEPLGALGVGFRQPRSFRPEEQEFLQALALQCSLALDRVNLIEAERRTRERALNEAAQSAQTLDSMSDCCVAFDRELRFTYLNRSAAAMYQRSARSLIGKHLFAEFPQSRTSPFAPAALAAMQTGEPFTLEYDSAVMGRWIEVRGYPTPEGVCAIFRDITPRRKAEQRQRMLAALISLFDRGLDQQHVLNRFCELIVPELADSCEIHIDENGLPAVHSSSGDRILDSSGSVVIPLIAQGTRLGTMRLGFSSRRYRLQHDELGFLEDLAHRMAAAIGLARAFAAEQHLREQAEHANQAKAEFLGVMSHELRTPLHAIGGYTQLMQLGVHGPLPERYHDYVNRIQAAQEHLLSLINRVLSFSRLQAGTFEYVIEPFRLLEVTAALDALLRTQIEARRLVYEVAVEPGIELVADQDCVRQILLNLLGNAIKFTPEGGVVRLAASCANGRCTIQVADSGAGIPADRLNSIFEPFVQVHRTSAGGGVGLGLAISRDLARAMNGEITVTSRPGAGSTFSVTVPGRRV